MMKKFVILLMVFLAAALLFAGGAKETETVEKVGKGGDLVIATRASSEPASLDGHIDPYQSTWLFNSFIADPLVIMAPDGTIQPALAERWETKNDSKSWVFYLRKDVKFQDGTAFNAEAVKYNLTRLKEPDLGSVQFADDIGPFTSVEVVDEYTVQINYPKPWVTLLDTVRRLPIWSPTAAEKYSYGDFDKHLIGTGPFMFKEWIPNDHITFVKWEDYGGWNSIQEHEGAVYLDSITLRFIGEEAVLGNLVNTGDAHLVQELPSSYVEDYGEGKKHGLVVGYQAGTGLEMIMNIVKPPLDQLKVRQALLYAVDQQEINELVYDGLYLPMQGPLNTVHPSYWDGVEKMYPYNPDKANQLLSEAGWEDRDGNGIREAHGVPGVKDGEELQIRFNVLHHVEIGEAAQIQLRKVGIDLKVEIVPGPVQIDRVDKRDFELMYERQRTPDPRVLDQVWNSKYYGVPGGWAWTGLEDSELDSILDKITSIGDMDERNDLAMRAQEIIMEHAAVLPTLSQPMFYAVSRKLKGFKIGAEGNWFFPHDMYIE